MKSVMMLLISGLLCGLAAEQMPIHGPIPFSQYDKNGDGSISEQEFNDVRNMRMEQRAMDGRPMRNAGNAPDFAYFDTNKDGKLSEKELTDGQNRRMQERMNGGMGRGMGGGMGGM